MTSPTPNSNLVDEKTLMSWLGYKNRGHLLRTLQEKNIPVILGREGRVCTTYEAINMGLGVNIDIPIDDDDFA